MLKWGAAVGHKRCEAHGIQNIVIAGGIDAI